MDRFVVGSGRCGSTLLSRMLDAHPEVTSIFEFFNGLDVFRRFSPQIEGAALAELLGAEQSVVSAALRRGHTAEEVVYPFDTPGARYARTDALPWLCVAMAPRLTDEPDRLFDDLLLWARARSEASAGEHYRALFAWLCDRSGTSHWIERSGSSVDYAGALAACFPDARFLHIHRDGAETALSMREHGIYRLPVAMLYDVMLPSGKRVSESGGFEFTGPVQPGDLVSQALETRFAPEIFGRYWSDQVVRGTDAAKAIGPDRFAEIAFEDLLMQPAETLGFIGEFFELPPNGDWIERASSLVGAPPERRCGRLSEPERKRLDESVRRGQQALEGARRDGCVRQGPQATRRNTTGHA